MRNHRCAMANSCPSYERDNCQGCQWADDGYYWNTEKKTNPFVEKLKEDIIKGTSSILAKNATKNKGSKQKKEKNSMEIKNVIFNDPATIVFWTDGTKTTVKCQKNDTYSKETGLAVAIAKKALGNKGNFNEVFKKWIPEYGKEDVGTKEVGSGKEDVGTKEVGDNKEPVEE